MIDRPHLERHLWQVIVGANGLCWGQRGKLMYGVKDRLYEWVIVWLCKSAFLIEIVYAFSASTLTSILTLSPSYPFTSCLRLLADPFDYSLFYSIQFHSILYYSVHYPWRRSSYQEQKLPTSKRIEEFQICISFTTHRHSHPGMPQLPAVLRYHWFDLKLLSYVLLQSILFI